MPPVDLGLQDRPCIVTGASRGIGLATARMLCAEGAAVLLAARDADAIGKAAASCAQAGGRALGLALDVTAPDAGERLVAACQQAFGAPYALVNNAGFTRARRLEDVPDEDWQAQWDVHVMAPMRLMRAAVPRMAAAGEGRVVNVCSSAGKRPSGTLDPPYSVTKAAQLSLSRVFADRYAAEGVLVNAVAPGAVAGSMWLAPGGLADQVAARQGISREQALEASASRLPRGKLAAEEEVAAVVVFLCSAQASNVVGAAWSVDGGAVPIIL
jgi:3-oxoacyl-[acyl-carrier protein] reductase